MDSNAYDKDYFVGSTKSNYVDYADCAMVLRRLYEMIVRATRRAPKTYLDAGCAYGFMVIEAMNQGADAFGFDISEFAIEQGRELLGSEKESYRLVVDQLPSANVIGMGGWKPNFELITCVEVLEHIPEEQIRASLQRLWDATAQGGFLAISPNTGVDGHEKDVTHVSVKPREWWLTLFDAMGLTEHRQPELESNFDAESYAQEMGWNGRMFIFRK